MRKFVVDFVSLFVLAALQALYMIANIIIAACLTLQRMWNNLVIPCITELGADVHFMGLIMLQAWYEWSGRACAACSKWMIVYARHCMKQSEQLIHKTWMHS